MNIVQAILFSSLIFSVSSQICDDESGGCVNRSYSDNSGCYQDEIAPQVGKYCKDHYDKANICNGTKDDCVLKGKEICRSDPNCHGIMYDKEWAEVYKGVKICSGLILKEKPEEDWSVFLKCRQDCYQDEIAPQLGKYCKDHYDKQNICNGTKNDCVLKGKEMCGLDPNCYGIMYDTEWAEAYKGVKICSSWTLEEKPEKDWSVFLKCRPGFALQCYKCEEKTNGFTNSCHLDDDSYGTTEICSAQESACFKEIKKNSDGVTVYQRGCIKRPIKPGNSNESFCEPMEDQNGYTNLQKCYCFENMCNGTTMTSLSMGLFGLLLTFILMK